jgi:hypothetical protein
LYLSALQNQKQHRQGNGSTQLEEGKLVTQTGRFQIETIGFEV